MTKSERNPNVARRTGREPAVSVSVCFYSYFKELSGCERATVTLSRGSTLGELFRKLIEQFPKLGAMQKSTLMAVGLDYEDRNYILQDGDEVSLFPPVQGG